MVALANTFEGTNAATITSSNTAGPDQFNSVNGTGVPVFDNTHAHNGATACKIAFASGVAFSAAYPTWLASISSTANAYVRFYIWLSAQPTVLTTFTQLWAVTPSVNCSIQINGTGFLRISNSAGTSVGATTATVPTAQWVRIEFEQTATSGTTATLAARMYSGVNLEGNTADTNGSLSFASQTVIGNVTQLRTVLPLAATQTAAINYWYDDVAYSDVAQPGAAPPKAARILRNYPQAVRRSTSW